MNRKIKYFFVVLLISSSFSQTSNIVNITLQGKFIERVKIIAGSTHSIPPHYLYGPDQYKFIINIDFSVEDITLYNQSLLYVISYLPENQITKTMISPENTVNIGPNRYRCVLPIVLKTCGYCGFDISTVTELGEKSQSYYFGKLSSKNKIYLSE